MFAPAIGELAAALLSGDSVDAAIQDFSCEYGLSSTGLRDSAVTVLGELETYAERQKAAARINGSQASQ
jgi:hypothetical protein